MTSVQSSSNGPVLDRAVEKAADLAMRLADLEMACQRWQRLAEARERELGELRPILAEIYRSRSWRLTKPLRQLSLLRQQWQKGGTYPALPASKAVSRLTGWTSFSLSYAISGMFWKAPRQSAMVLSLREQAIFLALKRARARKRPG